jgi:acyl carrier protein
MEPPSEPLVVLREQLPLSRPYVAPRTGTEQRLAEIWRTVLSMDAVGVDDDYYDLGGDSLLAAAIFRMIESSFLVYLPIATLVEAPSVAQLARRIDDLRAAGSQDEP